MPGLLLLSCRQSGLTWPIEKDMWIKQKIAREPNLAENMLHYGYYILDIYVGCSCASELCTVVIGVSYVNSRPFILWESQFARTPLIFESHVHRCLNLFFYSLPLRKSHGTHLESCWWRAVRRYCCKSRCGSDAMVTFKSLWDALETSDEHVRCGKKRESVNIVPGDIDGLLLSWFLGLRDAMRPIWGRARIWEAPRTFGNRRVTKPHRSFFEQYFGYLWKKSLPKQPFLSNCLWEELLKNIA